MTVIATRCLDLDGRIYHVRLDRPQRDGQGAEAGYKCQWELVDDSNTVVLSEAAFGEDSMQALILAITIIGNRLQAEYQGFTCCGMPGTGLLLQQLDDNGTTTFHWDATTRMSWRGTCGRSSVRSSTSFHQAQY